MLTRGAGTRWLSSTRTSCSLLACFPFSSSWKIPGMRSYASDEFKRGRREEQQERTRSCVSINSMEEADESKLMSLSKEELVSIILAQRGRNSDKQEEKSEKENEKGKEKETAVSENPAATEGSANQPCIQKKKREFDARQYGKRFIALKLSYIGWGYHGLASQTNVEETVEGHLFAALKKTRLIVDRESCNFNRCGRTDKGVSALGNVVSLVVRSNFCPAREEEGKEKEKEKEGEKEEEIIYRDTPTRPLKSEKEIDYVKAINTALPADIRVLGWAPVSKDFNARFSTKTRSYRYFFVKKNLDVEKMQEAAQKLIGEHDFRNFCKMDVINVHSFVRKIVSFDVCPFKQEAPMDEASIYEFRICGTAFLWHQVRCMAAVLFLVGEGREEPSIIDVLLDTKTNNKPSYVMASEVPLILYDAGYDDLEFIYDAESVGPVLETVYKRWSTLKVQTSLVGCMGDYLANEVRVKVPPEVAAKDPSLPDTLPYKELKPLLPKKKEKQHRPLVKRGRDASYTAKLQSMPASKKRRYEQVIAFNSAKQEQLKAEKGEKEKGKDNMETSHDESE